MVAATSYAEAESGGFVLDASAIAAKVAAAILPVDNSTWRDTVNAINGSLLNGATIASDATSRYTQFNGVDFVVDMGAGYRTIIPPANPYAVVVVGEIDNADGTLVAMRDNSPSVLQLFVRFDDLSFRQGGNDHNFTTSLAGGVTVVGISKRSSTEVEGYVDGSPDGTIDPSTSAPSGLDIPLSIGARWATYPATGFPSPALIRMVVLFDDELSDAEHASMASNPWQVFAAPAGDHVSELPSATITDVVQAPTIEVTEHNVSQLPAATIVLTRFAPTVLSTENNVSELPAGSLILATFAPTIQVTENNVSQLPSAMITLTTFPITVDVPVVGNLSLLPSANILLTPFSPVIVTTERPACNTVQKKDPTFSLFYLRNTGQGELRVTEAGEYREIEQAPDGGIPPWEK